MADCPLCASVKQYQLQQAAPFLIHEFNYSYWLFGSHQFYKGYSVLLLKNHARELHQLLPAVRNGFFDELMQAGSAMETVFNPWKMNYASYGNQVEHLHWHLIPRYEEEITKMHCPFSNEHQFFHYPTDIAKLEKARDLLKQIVKA